jgi:hypothetical protein
MLDALLAVIAAVRLAEGVAVGVLGFRARRWVLITWGAVAVLLAIPVAALYILGTAVPPAAAAALMGGHAILGGCVLTATLSSAGVIRRQDQLLQRLGVQHRETGWRP